MRFPCSSGIGRNLHLGCHRIASTRECRCSHVRPEPVACRLVLFEIEFHPLAAWSRFEAFSLSARRRTTSFRFQIRLYKGQQTTATLTRAASSSGSGSPTKSRTSIRRIETRGRKSSIFNNKCVVSVCLRRERKARSREQQQQQHEGAKQLRSFTYPKRCVLAPNFRRPLESPLIDHSAASAAVALAATATATANATATATPTANGSDSRIQSMAGQQ